MNGRARNGKDPDSGRDWGQEEKGTTEDEMVGWHHRLDGHGFGLKNLDLKKICSSDLYN